MAAFCSSEYATTIVSFGRSGYNKDDDKDDGKNYGRSGYNKSGKPDEDDRDYGRSGYNKDDDDEKDR